MAKRKLTDPYIRNLKNDTSNKRLEIYDSIVTGLAVRVTPTGRKTFVFRYYYSGHNKRFTIGSFPDISLNDARKQAREVLLSVKKGVDPMDEKRRRVEESQADDFKTLVEDYRDIEMKSLRAKTVQEYNRIFDVELLPKLGRKRVKEIDTITIMKLLDNIAIRRGKATMANRVRARIHTLFEFAVNRSMIQSNPVTKIKKYKNGETKRSRYYEEDEIRLLWDAFEKKSEPVQSVLKMLLLLGQRSKETRHMKWEHITGDVWVIPESLSKSKRKHKVPLGRAALQILENLRKLNPDSEYVFESPRKRKHPIESIKTAVKDIKAMTGIADFRVHDLRRTVATYMASLKVERTVLGKLLNHKGIAGDHQVTAVYDRHDYLDEKRQAVARWENYLFTLVESGSESEGRIIKMI